METTWIRIELPGILHFKFMEKVADDFGTVQAQNEALTMIIKKYIENPIPIVDVEINTSKGYRVLSQEIPKPLKEKIDILFYKQLGTLKCLSIGIKAIIQLYVNDKINIR